jgi:hypothetical protein
VRALEVFRNLSKRHAQRQTTRYDELLLKKVTGFSRHWYLLSLIVNGKPKMRGATMSSAVDHDK